MSFLKHYNYQEIDYSETSILDINGVFNFIDEHFNTEFSKCVQAYKDFDMNEMFDELCDLCRRHEIELLKVLKEHTQNISDINLLIKLQAHLWDRNMVLRNRQTLLYRELKDN